MLQVFGYPVCSRALLLSGELPLRYCSDRFAQRKPSWGLLERGHVHSLLTPVGDGVGLVEVAPAVPHGGSCWITGAAGVWKRMRLTRKTNSSLLRRFRDPCLLHNRRWKRLCPFREVNDVNAKRGRFHCIRTGFFCTRQKQQQQQYNLERLRFNRRGASTPLWRVESCSPPSRRPNPIPAIPPSVVRTPHLHGAPTTKETVKL